jgi:hypothetical protein
MELKTRGRSRDLETEFVLLAPEMNCVTTEDICGKGNDGEAELGLLALIDRRHRASWSSVYRRCSRHRAERGWRQ